MNNRHIRRSAAGVLMLGALLAGCGGDEGDAGTAPTKTQPETAKQTLDSIVDRCLASAKQFPDAESRKQGEAACRAAAANAPVGPGAPNSDQLSQRLREECEQAEKQGMTPEVKATCDGILE